MTDRQRKTIELFCEYLNQFQTPEDDKFIYTVGNWDPAHNEYATVETIASYNTGWYDCETYLISDGDDGGPNVLTMYFDTMSIHSTDLTVPRLGTQEFDTQLTIWLEDGKVVHPDD